MLKYYNTPSSPLLKVTSTCVPIVNAIQTILDSGASDNYIRPEDEEYVEDVRTEPGPTVVFPDSRRITANKNATIPLSNKLSKNAQSGHILPHLKSATLLSAGKLCDDGCDVILRQHDVHVIKHNTIIDKVLKESDHILKGHRNHTNKLWNIPVEKSKLSTNNFIPLACSEPHHPSSCSQPPDL